jgi:hypothetical protein
MLIKKNMCGKKKMMVKYSYKELKIRIALFVTVLLVLCSQVLADSHQNSQLNSMELFEASELIIVQTLSSGVLISSNSNSHVDSLRANFTFVPQNDERQLVLSQRVTPTPLSRTSDYIEFEWTGQTITHPLELRYTAATTIHTKQYATPVHTKVKYPYTQNELQEVDSKYLAQSDLIDITPQIRQKALELRGESADVYEISFHIAKWVEENIAYDLTTLTADASQKASWVFANRYGVCDELSTLYIALLRSLDIPAKFITGMSYSNSELFDTPWNAHAWVEVYMGEYGWIPVDLTYGQFGFVDATHIKLKESYDADESRTSYSWRSRNLDAISVTMLDLDVAHEILSIGEQRINPYTLSMRLLHDTVGFGSHNALIIELSNPNTAYVADTLYISTSEYVSVDDQRLPFFLKPGEQKRIVVPIHVENMLQKSYVYTLPIIVSNQMRELDRVELKAAFAAPLISKDDIFEFSANMNRLDGVGTQLSNEKISGVQCSQEKLLIIHKPFDITCRVEIKDQGDTFDLESVEVCLDANCRSYDAKKIRQMQQTNGSLVVVFSQVKSEAKAYSDYLEIKLADESGTYTRGLIHSYIVSDVAEYNLTGVQITPVITYPDLITLEFTVAKLSQAPSTNVYVTLGERPSRMWQYGSLSHDQPMRIQIHPNTLVGGKNSIPLRLYYDTHDDIIEQTYILEVDVGEVPFFENLKLRLARLFD